MRPQRFYFLKKFMKQVLFFMRRILYNMSIVALFAAIFKTIAERT